MTKNVIIEFLLLIIFISCNNKGYDMDFTIKWNDFPALPPDNGQQIQLGLAGALTGLISDKLLIAGGSNFPDTLPWFGGTKTYYDDIYSIDLNAPDSGWTIQKSKLPEALAYSVCISINNSIYCVGGEHSTGPTSHVYRISKVDNEFVFSKQTNLPQPISNSGVTSIDSKIYLVGGNGKKAAISDFYTADVSDSILNWTKLPDLPITLSNAAVVSQWDGSENCIYVLGGRNKTGELTTFYSTVWKFSPSKNTWNKVGDIASYDGQIVPLAAGTGTAFDNQYIFLFGGDNGILFNKTEDYNNRISAEDDSDKKQLIVDEKIQHLTSHQGFCRDIFVFNTFTNQCISVGKTPSAAQVTTSAVNCGNKYLIPNGEIRPGVRTPDIHELHIIKN